MIRRFFVHWGLILALTATSILILLRFGLIHRAVPVSVAEPLPRGVILLVPLDSRPPCTDYVTRIARMAGFQVLSPPAELLDNYRTAANKAGIVNWLRQNAARADAAILSVDMLVHGGLLASRQGKSSPESVSDLLSLLIFLHTNQPQLKLYAFNILPRLLISDDPLTEKYKQSMVEWSILQETTALFENPQDIRRLQELEEIVPREVTARYRKLFADNHHLNQQLINLTQTGVLAGLLIGQDDSAPFGLGNMERQRLENTIRSHSSLAEKVFITRGTDETALTLLGPVTHSPGDPRHKIFVHYTESHAAQAVLPYMPKPLAQTVAEKLAIASADVTGRLTEADIILVIHAGNSQSQERQLSAEARRIRAWVEAGRKVAIVDLATDWTANQTLLPYLNKQGVPLLRLAAYAGWNTASNSVGTAVTQAVLLLHGQETLNFAAALSRDVARIEFLTERILDDWYYQKNYRPTLNTQLENQKINPYNLQKSRKNVETRVNQRISGAYRQYLLWNWRTAIIPLPPPIHSAYAIGDLQIRSGLPWDRTFEIFVDVNISPASIMFR